MLLYNTYSLTVISFHKESFHKKKNQFHSHYFIFLVVNAFINGSNAYKLEFHFMERGCEKVEKKDEKKERKFHPPSPSPSFHQRHRKHGFGSEQFSVPTIAFDADSESVVSFHLGRQVFDYDSNFSGRI